MKKIALKNAARGTAFDYAGQSWILLENDDGRALCLSKIVELYVKELTREGSTMTINDVPKKLRKQVEDAIAAIEAAANAGTVKEGASE